MKFQTSNLNVHFKQLSTNTNRIVEEFTKPIHLNVFSRNKESLLLNCEVVFFEKDNWKMRPDIFCMEHYKDPYFYPVVLMINKLGSVFEFVPDNLIKGLIIAPIRRKMIKLLDFL